MAIMHRVALPVVFVFALAACGDLPSPTGPAATVRASLSQGGPPTPSVSPPAVNQFLSAICGFPVLESVTGREKVLELPGGRTISVFPELKITWTNVNTGKTVTRSTTGSVHVRPLSNGNTEIVLVGHNPVGVDFEGQVYHVFLSGRMTVILDPDGNLVQAPEVTGLGTDVCALIS